MGIISTKLAISRRILIVCLGLLLISLVVRVIILREGLLERMSGSVFESVFCLLRKVPVPRVVTYPNGSIMSIEYWDHGGLYKGDYYSPFGRRCGIVRKGTGTMVTFHDNGSPSGICFYVDGALKGPSVVWTKEGDLLRHYYYENEMMCYKAYGFFDNGQKRIERQFNRNGSLYREYYYNTNGSLVKRIDYDATISKEHYYGKDGVLTQTVDKTWGLK